MNRYVSFRRRGKHVSLLAIVSPFEVKLLLSCVVLGFNTTQDTRASKTNSSLITLLVLLISTIEMIDIHHSVVRKCRANYNANNELFLFSCEPKGKVESHHSISKR